MLYENCKIYGPYKRKDNRKHVVVIFPDGKRKTVSYPKYLTENRIGRYLKSNETVDHIDGNFDNNEPSNIRVINRSKHVSDDVKRKKAIDFICPICKKQFSLSGRKLYDAIRGRKKGAFGPMCSKICSGKYGKDVQINRNIKKIEEEIIPEYTTKKLLRSLNGETH